MTSLQRYKLTLAYRGTHYHGWQRQTAAKTWKGPTPLPGHGIPTVQEVLTRALAKVLCHPVTVVGASRTDAGVHAKGQVAHFDTHMTQIPMEGMRRALNHKLPDDIVVREIEPVEDTFDAILSAQCKRYQYFIWNALDRNPFSPELSWHRWQTLDVGAMKHAARYLVGEHDFASFCKPGHGRESTVRFVKECSVAAVGHRIVIGVEGAGFLWFMVRIMVGTLVDIGLGIYSQDQIPAMLAARDRRASGSTAPPTGLFLQWVKSWPADHLRTSDPEPDEA
ncbi:MAG: tRNA pseudouridine(38-40) synthase TruA [Planctomycetota bacterium]|nr:tRNA pseudouridine(38-40) synthase TruA [Planctomycetota bacterium]